MKSNLDKYVKEVISGFQANRGKASVYCFPPISNAELVFHLINTFYIKSPGAQVFIAVDGFATRKAILDRLAKETGTSYNVKALSADYIKTTYKYDYKLIITVGVNDNLELIKLLNRDSKFMLAIHTKNIMDSQYINSVREILPDIEVTVSDASVRADSIYSPVEEYRLGIPLSVDDNVLYKKYSEYIATSVSIFGDISNIDKCKFGDPKFYISAAEYRDAVAKENGWSTELDTTVEWSRKIDDIYNPNILLERANNFYNITKLRRDLVTDNTAKLEVILNLCNDNIDKNILIVSKRGDFAASITKYINQYSTIKCGDYHDSIESSIAIDEYGNPLLIKSGKDKGKPKVIGAQAISTLNMRLFNNNMINVLSIKNSSNIKLEIAVDLVIFTSPFVDDIFAFKTRFTGIEFTALPSIIYKVYCIGTIENKQLSNAKESALITVIDNTDNIVGYDEASGDIIL